jgi:hypothetical protein
LLWKGCEEGRASQPSSMTVRLVVAEGNGATTPGGILISLLSRAFKVEAQLLSSAMLCPPSILMTVGVQVPLLRLMNLAVCEANETAFCGQAQVSLALLYIRLSVLTLQSGWCRMTR